MKKKYLMAVMIIMILCFGLTGCDKYSSSYSAVLLVRSNTSKSASTSFYKLKGQLAFKLKSKKANGVIKYKGKVEEGEITVYVDDGDKKELFTVKSGEKVDTSSVSVNKGSVYVVIKTKGTCTNGSFDFEVK